MLSIFLAIGILIGLFFYFRKNYYQPRNKPLNIKPNNLHKYKVKPELEKRLLILVNYDQLTAKRLINHAKLKHPNQPINWYYEKVIFDLERDRRY